MFRIRRIWNLFLRFADGHIEPPQNRWLRELFFGVTGKLLLGVFLGLCICSVGLSFVMAYYIDSKEYMYRHTKDSRNGRMEANHQTRAEMEKAAETMHSLLTSIRNK